MTRFEPMPADWCVGRPPAERLARWLLDDAHPGWRYDLTNPHEVRAVVAQMWAGNVLQAAVVERQELLDRQTEVVALVLEFVVRTTALALAELEASP